MLDNVDMSRQINEKTAIEALAALAQPTRIDVFRRLIKSYPDEIAAGEIARQCKIRHNTMSTHLAILSRADSGRGAEGRADDALRREVRALSRADGFSVAGLLPRPCGDLCAARCRAELLPSRERAEEAQCLTSR